MKEISKILLLLISIFTFSGCYTVAWQPGEALPTKNNLKRNQSSFYNVKDFGVFSNYYYSAWWVNPDNDFLRDNLTALYDIDDDNVIIISDGINFPIIDPIIVTTNPTKRRNTKSLKKSSPTHNKNSNKNKLRNNNGGRKNLNGRNR